jgi:hypothetical protein
MNYLVKNAKVLIKFFKNKNYSQKKINEAYTTMRSYNSVMGSRVEGLMNIIPNSTVLSFPSFQGNIDKNSLYSQNIGNGSSNSYSSSNGHNVNTLKNLTILSSSKYLNTGNVNTMKSTGNSDQGEYNIINNTVKNQTLNLYINPTQGNYLDFFTQNEVDWNLIKREMVNSDSRSNLSDQTPSFSSNNYDVSDSFYSMLSNYYVKNINLRPNDRGKNFASAGGINQRNNTTNTFKTPNFNANTLKMKPSEGSGTRSPHIGKTSVNIKGHFNKLNTIVEENKNTRWNK